MRRRGLLAAFCALLLLLLLAALLVRLALNMLQDGDDERAAGHFFAETRSHLAKRSRRSVGGRRSFFCNEELPDERSEQQAIVDLEQRRREAPACPRVGGKVLEEWQDLSTPHARASIPDCGFHAIHAADTTTMFAGEAYDLARFFFEALFIREGWVALPVAGTALGVVRNAGMLPGDDDLDFVMFAPPKRRSTATVRGHRLREKEEEEVEVDLSTAATSYTENAAAARRHPRDASRSRATFQHRPASENATSWLELYEAFDRHLRKWASAMESVPSFAQRMQQQMRKKWGRTGGSGNIAPTTGFAWERTHFYRLEAAQASLFAAQHRASAAMDELIAHAGDRGRTQAGPGDTADDATSSPKLDGTMTRCHRRQYAQCLASDGVRECGAQYTAQRIGGGDGTELRRMFFGSRPCLPNHFYLCFQPTSFMWPDNEEEEGHAWKEGEEGAPPARPTQAAHRARRIFTNGTIRDLGPLCRAKFGPTQLVVPQRLPEFVEMWYGSSWCVATGPVLGPRMAMYKSWNE